MTEKERCEQLKRYRNKIAMLNGIDFKSKECDSQGYCPGYCPACDEEILFLEKELAKKVLRGEEVLYQGLIKIAFDSGTKIYKFNPSDYKRLTKQSGDKTEEEIEKEIDKIIKSATVDTIKNDGESGDFFLGWIDLDGDDW
ncbi:MAG: hypothetical protein IKA02_04345 [Clostridia bacterium]|nr:hypothetical protein [Clostridia bacterium]